MTDPPTYSRRDVLVGSGALAGSLAAAGCVDAFGGDARFRFKSFPLRGGLQEFVDTPYGIDAKYAFNYSRAYKEAKVDELVDSGTVATRGWPLNYRTTWGDGERERRQCLRYEGTYYRVHVEDVEEDVARDRSVFYLDWTADEPADGDDVATFPVDSLSERDGEILATALEGVPPSGRRVGDPVDYGIVYHEDLDEDESELVPDPPFDYFEFNGETFRAASGEIAHERTERTFSAEAVAESADEYTEYASASFPDARFPEADLSEEARDVLSEVSGPGGGRSYEEEPPPSDGLEEVLTHLGIAQDLRPHEEYDERAEFQYALAEYRGGWLLFALLVYP